MPGQAVRPAHSHPNGEEVIYIISGSGRVMVGGEVQDDGDGDAVGESQPASPAFPQKEESLHAMAGQYAGAPRPAPTSFRHGGSVPQTGRGPWAR